MAERFAGVDNDQYHFNLPESLQQTDRQLSYDALNLHGDQDDSRYGVEVYVDNVLVQPETVSPTRLGQTYAAVYSDVNAEVASGYDNIITLKESIIMQRVATGWASYVQLSKVPGALMEPTIR